jgi:hypothetical protein
VKKREQHTAQSMACEQASLFATVASHGGMRLARDELRRLNVAVEPHADDGKLWFRTALGLHALSTLKIPERVCVSVCNVAAPDARCALRIRKAMHSRRQRRSKRWSDAAMRHVGHPIDRMGTFAGHRPTEGVNAATNEQLPTPALAG